MARSWPSGVEMRLWKERLGAARAGRRAKWLAERERNIGLIANSDGAWERETPVAGDPSGASTIMVRNTVGQNARAEVNRLMPKEPYWIAQPTEGTTVLANGVEVDNTARCTRLTAATNLVAHGSGLVEELERCALDGEGGNVAFLLVTYMGHQGDVGHGSGVPLGREDGGEGGGGDEEVSASSKRALKRGGIQHGGVSPFFPTFLRLDPTTVYVDPSAKTLGEVNWFIREFDRPVESMRNDWINRVDPETGEVKRERKYWIPEWVESNVRGDRERALRCFEAHYRVVAADPEATRDGYEYKVLVWIEEKEAGAEMATPECIRSDDYAIDMGGFGIEMYAANLTNDDLLGYVPAIRDSIQSARLFNTSVSMLVDWNLRNKTVHVYDPKHVSEEDIDNLRKAEAQDWVPIDKKGDVPFENIFGVIPANPIPDAAFSLPSMLSGLTNEGSGRSENQRGVATGVKTASEAQIVQQETSGQVAAKQKRFRLFAERGIRKGMIVFTHVMPERGPMKDGTWEIPDPDNPGRFLRFGREDLGAKGEIVMDLVSQQLKDETVVVAQGMQLMDMSAKVLSAPPDVQRKLMGVTERTIAAMGPDWESAATRMFTTDDSVPHPHLEHIMMLDGQQVTPDQKEDLRMHLDLHRAMLVNGPREQPGIWNRELGRQTDPETGEEVSITPVVFLAQHVEDTMGLMQQMGVKIPGLGAAPGGGGGNEPGSGAASGRAPQAVPNPGEVAAGAENAMMPNQPGVRGMQEGM